MVPSPAAYSIGSNQKPPRYCSVALFFQQVNFLIFELERYKTKIVFFLKKQYSSTKFF